MSAAKRITGTFIDEITHDIPSQNWGRKQWDREFELYSKIGIDTLVIIRTGYQNKCIFPSKSIPDILPFYEDLGEILFELADKHELKVFFGTYDSGFHWHRGSYWTEVELNQKFIDEAFARYGHHASFAGWYQCHESSRYDSHIDRLFNEIGGHCKQVSNLPVLISPFPQGAKQFSGSAVMTLDESMDHWNRIFGECKENIDICAFQDGQIHYHQLPEFHRQIQELGNIHNITIWSNVESFDRDMPIKFPPADWRYLRLKLEEASKHVEKLITFEFPHFMSPHSCYPSAHNLFERYCEHFDIIL